MPKMTYDPKKDAVVRPTDDGNGNISYKAAKDTPTLVFSKNEGFYPQINARFKAYVSSFADNNGGKAPDKTDLLRIAAYATSDVLGECPVVPKDFGTYIKNRDGNPKDDKIEADKIAKGNFVCYERAGYIDQVLKDNGVDSTMHRSTYMLDGVKVFHVYISAKVDNKDVVLETTRKTQNEQGQKLEPIINNPKTGASNAKTDPTRSLTDISKANQAAVEQFQTAMQNSQLIDTNKNLSAGNMAFDLSNKPHLSSPNLPA